jgi:hypothetical protein
LMMTLEEARNARRKAELAPYEFERSVVETERNGMGNGSGPVDLTGSMIWYYPTHKRFRRCLFP